MNMLGQRAVIALIGASFALLQTQKAHSAEGAAEGAKEEKHTYPVSLVRPLAKPMSPVVHGYGTLASDPHGQRSITAATMVEIEQIHVVPGQSVRRGQRLFTVASDPSSYLAYQQATTARRVADAELARLKAQLQDHIATLNQVETAEKALQDADAAVSAARRQLAGAPSEAVSAPIDGVVTAIPVAIGDRPAAGTPMATIAPSALSGITIGIEPAERTRVHVGDRATVKAVQVPGVTRTARVTVVGAALDKETRMVPVTLAFDGPASDDLIAGLSVEAKIATRALATFVLPRTALIRDDEALVVFEVLDGKAHRVPVELVHEEGAKVAVTGALSSTHSVVTIGSYELEDGAAVAEQKP